MPADFSVPAPPAPSKLCVAVDLDGTLAFTHEANAEAYAQAFEAVGLAFDREAYARAFGLRADAMLDRLAPGSDADLRRRLRAAKAEAYSKLGRLIRPNSGLLSLLRGLKGISPIGLASTASRENGLAALRAIGAEDLFDTMVFGGDVAKGKPDPEAYLRCFGLLEAGGAGPWRRVAFEDTGLGAAAAKAAGADVVRVGGEE